MVCSTRRTACHRPVLPVDLPRVLGAKGRGSIAPYTDLALHDLGPKLADRDASDWDAATEQFFTIV